MLKIPQLSEGQLAKLVENRWQSSDSVADIVKKTYEKNLNTYKNQPEWLALIPRKKSKVRANRIFVNVESVINSLIANPPRPTIFAGSDNPDAKTLAQQQEKYFLQKYDERNVKETIRKGLRNLYFGRLIVLKPFWNARLNDFDARAIDPRKVRMGKNATKEDDSEFFIEEITDKLDAVLVRFPKKKEAILSKYGVTDEAEILITNPDVTYKEAWIREYVIFKLDDIILGVTRNPYWDWDGMLVTPEEEDQLKNTVGDQRRNLMRQIKNAQSQRQPKPAEQPTAQPQQPEQPQQAEVNGAQPSPIQPKEDGTLPPLEGSDQGVSYRAYYFNHFDHPRKPYIFATIFNNENTPVGQTDMIEQATPLQEDVDKAKRDISENAEMVNGWTKVDSATMDKSDAQKLRYESQGVVWGKGVKEGVTREFGTPLPSFVIQNMQDSRTEIDNIMAASSAFRGQREGQETKAGRLALVDQSYLRLNELVQVTDYVCYELFNWFYQLARIRYTEHHYAKIIGKDMAQQVLTIIQDDFMDGAEVRVIAGKMLPEDREFKYEQASADVKAGYISVPDYLEIANYNNPKELAKNAFLFRVAPAMVVGLTDDEIQKIPHPIPQSRIAERIEYRDLPPAARVQWLGRMGITTTVQEVIAAEVAQAMLDNAAKGQGKEVAPDTEQRVAADIAPAIPQQNVQTAPTY